jgi:uracil-DNA glycosylase
MDWETIIGPEQLKPYFRELTEFVKMKRSMGLVFPARGKVLTAINETPYDTVKVIIIGQDPYTLEGQAHGLAFSTLENKTPYSLQVIFRELYSNFGNEVLKLSSQQDNNLLSWAHQGVLLLNRVLTVDERKSKSHAGRGWEKFTDAIINSLLKDDRPLIWVLWGDDAKKALQGKKLPSHQHFMYADHPDATRHDGNFIGCGHFLKINKILLNNDIMPINWSLYPLDGDVSYVPIFDKLKDYLGWKDSPEGRELFYIKQSIKLWKRSE